MEQIGIAIFGVAAIFFVGMKTREWRRWGYACGLCSQPFWFYTTWKHEQWGIFALAVFYTISWLVGFYNHWIAKSEEDECQKQ